MLVELEQGWGPLWAGGSPGIAPWGSGSPSPLCPSFHLLWLPLAASLEPTHGIRRTRESSGGSGGSDGCTLACSLQSVFQTLPTARAVEGKLEAASQGAEEAASNRERSYYLSTAGPAPQRSPPEWD